MGIREKLNNQPRVAVGLGAGLATVAIVLIAVQLGSSGGQSAAEQAFFSVDDGQTWFSDDVNQIPPFTHDGKEAVRAHVFECDGKRFVNHLERFTPERRKFAEAAAEAAKSGQPPPALPAASGQTANWGQEVKKPGGKEWIPAGNLAKASVVFHAKCPNGGGGEPLPVTP